MIANLTDCFNPEPGDYDVLYGKGAGLQKYLGNKNYRSIVNYYGERYSNGSKLVKNQIVENILEHVRVNEGRFYRFISTNTLTGKWFEVKREEVYAKVKQALRDYGKKTKVKKEKTAKR